MENFLVEFCGEPSRAERGGVAEEARMNCNDNRVGEMSALLHSVWKRRGGGVFLPCS